MGIRTTGALLALATTLVLGISESRAQTTTWHLPSGFSDEQFVTKLNRTFADEVAAKTNGAVKITIHSNSSLYKMADILPAVRGGQVQIGEIFLNTYVNDDPVFGVDTLPFLARGREEAWGLYQASKPHLERRLADRGLRLLYSVPWPGQGFYSTEPLQTIEDLSGLKVRVGGALASELVVLLGSQPIVLPWTETPQAFLTGMVNALITSSSTLDAKPWEWTKHYYTFNAWHPRNAVIVNEAAWAGLAPEHQQAILDIASEVEKQGWDEMQRVDDESRAALAQGGIVVEAPPAGLAEQISAIAKPIITEWAERVGTEGVEIISAYERLRQ